MLRISPDHLRKEKGTTVECRSLWEMLEREAARRNVAGELSRDRPDPLWIASKFRDERIALICALFGYGSARQIVGFLGGLDFSLLEADEETIRLKLRDTGYRFQSAEDVTALFVALRRLNGVHLGSIVREGYRQRGEIRDGLWKLIEVLWSVSPRESRGYRFLIGRVPPDPDRCGPFKRYMMYFRWMVRRDALDLGLWDGIDPADLIIPLDTHTHRVGMKLGLVKRRTYDMKAALELTERLKEFDANDPVKYDFVLYRIGQEGIV